MIVNRKEDGKLETIRSDNICYFRRREESGFIIPIIPTKTRIP